jgi:hypothetical protein
MVFREGMGRSTTTQWESGTQTGLLAREDSSLVQVGERGVGCLDKAVHRLEPRPSIFTNIQ